MNQVTDVVDKQLIAYNELDFDSFSSCYHQDIISYDIESGKRLDNLCARNFFNYYQEKFTKNPEIQCQVIQRMVHNNMVVDKEYITSCNGSNHYEMVIYMVEGGLIRKMWFTAEIQEENK
jgi:hypothetical protein